MNNFFNCQKVNIITTGGTIEKTYSENDGTLKNRTTVVKEIILPKLRLPYLTVEVREALSKDSLFMDDGDREKLCQDIIQLQKENYPVVVLHGTDTMDQSARYCCERILEPQVPIVFTGAMRPLEFHDTDALQNITEALLASRLLNSGIFLSFHGKIFKAPHFTKDRERGTFVLTS